MKSIYSVVVATIILFLFTELVYAQEITIFDIRRPIAMSKNEKVEKDFFINAGKERGIKPGVEITVTRSLALYDVYLNRSPGNLVVPVGKLKIIHSQKGLSVGRLISTYSQENIPTLEYRAVMVGDKIDLSSMRKFKRKTASIERKKRTRPQGAMHSPVYGPVMSSDFASKMPSPSSDIEMPSMQ